MTNQEKLRQQKVHMRLAKIEAIRKAVKSRHLGVAKALELGRYHHRIIAEHRQEEARKQRVLNRQKLGANLGIEQVHVK